MSESSKTVSSTGPTVISQGEHPGTQIGPYKLISRIGEGGFGVVWLAERREPFTQRVAIKILKAGMDSTAVVARFDQERQALALMAHAHIAKVIDGGITPPQLGARPFFVMEYVAGRPITALCDELRFTLRERLDLFLPICDAVQHAHQRGIIHRDLKPSNILVARDGDRFTPKIIDFGIAKAMGQALTEQTLFTHDGQLIGTPEYMSPEQAAGEPGLDTRTDVYSLGVVLYELLAGALPFEADALRNRGFAEICRIIREEDPPKPSTRLSGRGDRVSRIALQRKSDPQHLAYQLRHELEWIPLKAIRKAAEARYRTPLDIADDIRNYLEGRTLTAGPESHMYRARKFVVRHRWAVLAGCAILTLMLAGLLGTSVGMLKARAAARAEADANGALRRRTAELQHVARFQASMLSGISLDAAGRRLLNDLHFRLDDSLAMRKTPDALRLATLEQFRTMLAAFTPSEVMAGVIRRTFLEPAVAVVDREFRNEPLAGSVLRETLANLSSQLGVIGMASDLQRTALELRRTQLGNEHPEVISAQRGLALILMTEGRGAEAEPLLRSTIETQRRTLGPDNAETLRTLKILAGNLSDQGKFEEAEKDYKYLLDAYERGVDLPPDDKPPTMLSFSFILQRQNKLTEAEAWCRQALDLSRRMYGERDPRLLPALHRLASILREAGKLSEAEQIAVSVLEERRRALGNEHAETTTALFNLSLIYCAQHRFADAEALLLPAISTLESRGTGASVAYRTLIKATAELYQEWNAVQPDGNLEGKAAQWRAKHDELRRQVVPSNVDGDKAR